MSIEVGEEGESYEKKAFDKPIKVLLHNGPTYLKMYNSVALSNRTKPRTELQKGQRVSCAKQKTSAQLLFHIRLDPLKLPRNPLKVVAAVPGTLLQYWLMGALGGWGGCLEQS